jgi:hypothetical protein
MGLMLLMILCSVAIAVDPPQCACESALLVAQTEFNATTAILQNATQACSSPVGECAALLAQVQSGLIQTQNILLNISACDNDAMCRDVPQHAVKSLPKANVQCPSPSCGVELKQLTLDFLLFSNSLSDDMLLCCF